MNTRRCPCAQHEGIHGGINLQLHSFLTLHLDQDEWSASCPGCFNPGVGPPSTHQTGDWVGPSAFLNGLEKRQNLLSLPVIKCLGRPACSPVTSDYATPAAVPSVHHTFK